MGYPYTRVLYTDQNAQLSDKEKIYLASQIPHNDTVVFVQQKVWEEVYLYMDSIEEIQTYVIYYYDLIELKLMLLNREKHDCLKHDFYFTMYNISEDMEKKVINELQPIFSKLRNPDDEYYCSIHDVDVIPNDADINRRKEDAIDDRKYFLQ